MSLLERVREATRHDPSRYVPFLVDGVEHGRVRRDVAHRLAAARDVFVAEGEGLALAEELVTPAARTEAVEAALRPLVGEGWRDERYDVVADWGRPPAFAVDRSCASILGIRGFGVHVNGLVERADGLHVWVGRRSQDRRVCPGQLDHLVAGGVASGHGAAATLRKEAWEEAGLRAEIVGRARAVGCVSYRLDVHEGLRDDTLFVYDLVLDDDVVPENQDGEVEDFELWPVERVRDTLATTSAFKFNVGLVLVDLLVRRGLLAPDDAGYVELVRRLRR